MLQFESLGEEAGFWVDHMKTESLSESLSTERYVTSWVKQTGLNFVWDPGWYLQTGTNLVEPEKGRQN